MAKEDPKPAPGAATPATATRTADSSEPATPTEPQAPPKAPEAPPADPPPQAAASDPMVAWLEERIAREQYSSPAWQAMTSALLFYRGLKANAPAQAPEARK